MIKKHVYILLIFGYSISVCAQNQSNKVSFEQLISEFKNYGSEWGFVKKDTPLPRDCIAWHFKQSLPIKH